MMMIRWISKDGGIPHIYTGAVSVCKSSSLIEPFAKKINHSDHKGDYCTICKGIIRTNQVIKIKKGIQKTNDRITKFQDRFDITPVDALMNLLAIQDTTLENIKEDLDAKDFGGILPIDVLAFAIMSKKVHVDDIAKIIYPSVDLMKEQPSGVYLQ